MARPIINRAADSSKEEQQLAHYRELIKLDLNDLDNAAMRQAHIYMEIGEKHAFAVSERDKAKNELAKIDAELAVQVRSKNPKLSAGAVYDEVILLPKHQIANAACEATKRTSDQWGVLKDAFEMRSKMIQQLTQQYATGYFSTSRAGSSEHVRRSADAAEGREALHRHRRES